MASIGSASTSLTSPSEILSGITLVGIGVGVYYLWKNDFNLGKTAGNILSGLGVGAVQASEDVGKKVYQDALKPAYKEILKPAGKETYNHVLKPVGKTIYSKVLKPGGVKLYSETKKDVRKVRKAFSKKQVKHNLKKIGKTLFHF